MQRMYIGLGRVHRSAVRPHHVRLASQVGAGVFYARASSRLWNLRARRKVLAKRAVSVLRLKLQEKLVNYSQQCAFGSPVLYVATT